ncbi:hypothetical protein P7C73_g4022, partial [Tremellales sp. Uapishka_1]
MSGAVILINGYPGVGKSTVARELAKLLPNSQLVDSDALHRIASSIHPPTARQYNPLVDSLRQTLLDSLDSSADQVDKQIYLFSETNFSPNQYTTLSPTLLFVHIILSASQGVNTARIEQKGGDADSLMELRMEEEIPHLFEQRGVNGEYEIDTSALDAEAIAGAVGEFVLDVLRNEGWWIQLNRVKVARP